MIIPVGGSDRQQMYRITKTGPKTVNRETFDYFSFVPLKGEEGWK